MHTSSNVTLSISGMSCSHCVAAVQMALKAVPGIASAQVQVGSATIIADPGADADAVRTAAVRAVRGAGYDVQSGSVPAATPTA